MKRENREMIGEDRDAGWVTTRMLRGVQGSENGGIQVFEANNQPAHCYDVCCCAYASLSLSLSHSETHRGERVSHTLEVSGRSSSASQSEQGQRD